jgi:uncharacterized protein
VASQAAQSATAPVIPIRTYIIKVTAFCNLNCSYCYMFNLEDQSFRARPKVLPLGTLEHTARKIVEHAILQSMAEINIIFHGGEPLLAGREWFHRALELFQRAGGNSVRFSFSVQSNGVLIDPEWVELFRRYRMSIALSLDGSREVNDRARVNFAGRGSYDDVLRGLRLVQSEPTFGGLLCVIDPAENGLATYRHFRDDLGVKQIDFLLPLEYNWDHPPPGHAAPHSTPYADYLIPIFDDWWAEDDSEVELRFFSTILGYLVGDIAGLDAIGGCPVSFGVIETDGGIEPLDVLRTCGDGFTNLGLNIRDHAIARLYDRPLFQEALKGQAGLCEICQACPLHNICGAGYLPHRFSRANAFANPSVYCRDLWKLINHIADAAISRLRPSTAVDGPCKTAVMDTSTLKAEG